MNTSTGPAAGSEEFLLTNPPSPWLELWRDFRRNKGAVVGLSLVLVLLFLAIFANFIAPHSPIEQYRDAILTPPSWEEGGSSNYLLGTDAVGRDMLSRLIFGTRLSLSIGLISVTLSLSIGIVLGLIAAFAGGKVETSIMRLMDVLLALPSLLLAVAVIAILGPGLANAMYAIAIVRLPGFVRLTRATAMSELSKDYVIASRIAAIASRITATSS